MKIIKKYHRTGSADEVMGLTPMISQWQVEEDEDGNVISETKVGGPAGDPSTWYKAVEITEEEYQKLFSNGRGVVYSQEGVDKGGELYIESALKSLESDARYSRFIKDATFDVENKGYTPDELTAKYGKAVCEYVTKLLK